MIAGLYRNSELSEKADYMIFGHFAGRVTTIRMGIENEIIVAKITILPWLVRTFW